MSQAPQDPNAKPSATPSSSPEPETQSKKLPLLFRVLITGGGVAISLLLFWLFVGDELWSQMQEYQAEQQAVDSSAPVGYIGLNYRKEYNSRPPQFHFEEGEKKLLWASIGDGETPEFYDVTEAQFDPLVLQGGFGRDSIPGIDYPILQEPDGDVASNIGNQNEVAGVQLEAGPRAYPLGALKKVEVVNDFDGDIPIAIVFARGPDTVHVYRREIDGQPITLGTSGYATDEKVPLLYDRKTKGLWLSDPDGESLTCVNGEHIGTRLPKHIEMNRLSWGDWRRQHRDTLVLVGNDRDKPIPEE